MTASAFVALTLVMIRKWAWAVAGLLVALFVVRREGK